MSATAQQASGVAPDARGLPTTSLSIAIDAVIKRIGEAASWLWFILVLVIVVNVAFRYLLGRGYIAFEELQWHLYGAAYMLGLAYVIQTNGHVRIDVLAEHWEPKTRAWIEFIGILVFLLPFSIAILIDSIPFVLKSWELKEISPAPGGLSYRWAIKAFLAIGFLLITLAAVSRLSRVTAFLFGFPRPVTNRLA